MGIIVVYSAAGNLIEDPRDNHAPSKGKGLGSTTYTVLNIDKHGH